jgi:hypothetical protein
MDSLFKTKLCRNFLNKGMCRYGNVCRFINEINDLRSSSIPKLISLSHPKMVKIRKVIGGIDTSNAENLLNTE